MKPLKNLIYKLIKYLEYFFWIKCTNIDPNKDFLDVYQKSMYYTLTSKERMLALFEAIQYINKYDIKGDIVECGIYKGGSTMLCALTLNKLKNQDKKIYLYDTFEGMPMPTEKDISYKKNFALSKWTPKGANGSNWCNATIEEVMENMYKTGYPQNKLIFVKGKVEETIPKVAPEKIALLRLDTDWYKSTYHELFHLYPRLITQGVIIIDDYGHWKGAKEAVDQYFREHNIKIMLNRIDYTGRIGIKM